MNLESFIKKHDKLLEAIGVFGALTAFLAQLKGFEDLALIPLIISFVLIIELIGSFPDIDMPLKTSVKLMAFEFLMVAFFIGVGYYILVRYVTAYYRLFSYIFFWLLYPFIAIKIAQKKVNSTDTYESKIRIRQQFVASLDYYIGCWVDFSLELSSFILLVKVVWVKWLNSHVNQ